MAETLPMSSSCAPAGQLLTNGCGNAGRLVSGEARRGQPAAQLLETGARGWLEGLSQAILRPLRPGNDEPDVQPAHASLGDDWREPAGRGFDIDHARLADGEGHNLDQRNQLAAPHKRMIAQRGQG